MSDLLAGEVPARWRTDVQSIQQELAAELKYSIARTPADATEEDWLRRCAWRSGAAWSTPCWPASAATRPIVSKRSTTFRSNSWSAARWSVTCWRSASWTRPGRPCATWAR